MGGTIGTALLSKITQIISNKEAEQMAMFLPLAEGWDMREIAFDLPTSLTGISDRDNLNLRGTFARRVNNIPGSGDVWTYSGTYLTDIYQNVLEGPVLLAKTSESPEEKTRIRTARSIIGTADYPKKKYRKYLVYRDKHRALEQEFRQLSSTIANTTDPTLKDSALNGRNQVQTQLDENYQEWIALGYKLEIDEALQTLYTAFSNSSITKWKEWKADFSLVIQQSDSLGGFYPTGYRPEKLFSEDAGWIKFTLSESEIDALANNVPPEILRTQSALGETSFNEGQVQEVSMEIARVDVERPWFHSELFKSRFWKWSDANHPLISDGQKPWPNGQLPGYVIGMLLVRNINITLRELNGDTEINEGIRILGNLVLESKVLNQVGTPISIEPLRGDKLLELVNKGNIDPHPIETMDMHDVIKNITHEIKNLGSDSFRMGDFSNIIRSHHSESGAVSSSINSATYLVAYIVQQVPKSPDPDSELKWS
ncbi:hypothetical protein BHL21_18725 [Bacillus cereus]|uniref:hypothetical protein n=1 Tax=Bacillus cereus TaxID=1396 RepID=UPI00099525B5|nr:hypothetical protein [Bacillus cereus]OPA14906.1 hypothetical protein BHL21_18725 [Bacillus cereus]